jgi:hypothetical protein
VAWCSKFLPFAANILEISKWRHAFRTIVADPVAVLLVAVMV